MWPTCRRHCVLLKLCSAKASQLEKSSPCQNRELTSGVLGGDGQSGVLEVLVATTLFSVFQVQLPFFTSEGVCAVVALERRSLPSLRSLLSRVPIKVLPEPFGTPSQSLVAPSY